LNSDVVWIVAGLLLGTAAISRSLQFYRRGGERLGGKLFPYWNSTIFRAGGVVGGIPAGVGIWCIATSIVLLRGQEWQWLTFSLFASISGAVSEDARRQ
jgi:hypothetical protein